MLWLNDAVNAEVRAVDPMETVKRIATMLFEGQPDQPAGVFGRNAAGISVDTTSATATANTTV